MLRRIGQGTYGCVVEARDRVTGGFVAVKKIRQAFELATEVKHVLREIRLLRHFNHDNVLGLLDIMLMSVSTSEVVTIRERIFDASTVTPAVRTNSGLGRARWAGRTHWRGAMRRA